MWGLILVTMMVSDPVPKTKAVYTPSRYSITYDDISRQHIGFKYKQ
jgi:hypothetical protein